MADTTTANATGVEPTDESPAQRAARLRREKRNAKILTGGSDRLNKITSLGGRIEGDTVSSRSSAHPSPKTIPSRGPTTSDGHHDDPAEVDISQMFQRPSPNFDSSDPQALFRQMLMGAGPQPGQGGPQPGMMGPDGQAPGQEEDPMMQMMQQMLGGGAGGEGGGLPPGLASMFGGGAQQQEPDTWANNVWRIVHAAFSLLLGLYAATTFTFTGSRAARLQYAVGEQVAPKLFWIFATGQLLLQSSRYFIDGGKLPASGILGGMGAMLPEPYANYVRIVSRYSIIYTTVVADATVVLFILGFVAWWKGLAAA